MYSDTIDHFANLARNKADTLSNRPLAFLTGALMAGAYVGIGIILIFSVGGTLEPGWQKLIMGLSFGIALTLVVFACSRSRCSAITPRQSVLPAWRITWCG